MAKVEVRVASSSTSPAAARLGAFRRRASTCAAAPSRDCRYRIACSTPRAPHACSPGRAVLHALPIGFSLDGARRHPDPRGMIGEALGVDMHVVTAEAAAARNLMLAVERCHLDVEARGRHALRRRASRRSSTTRPRWAASSSIWAAARRRVGVFAGGHLVHVDAYRGRRPPRHHGRRARPLDPARRGRAAEDALRLGDRHRLRRARDDRRARRSTRTSATCRTICRTSQLVRIIKPRVEEILELVRDRLQERRLRGAGRPPRRADRRREPAHRPARSRAPHPVRARSASAGRSASRACRRRRRARPSRPRSAFWSIRRSRTSSISSRARARLRRHRHGDGYYRPRRAMASRRVSERDAGGRRRRRGVRALNGDVPGARRRRPREGQDHDDQSARPRTSGNSSRGSPCSASAAPAATPSTT